MLTLLFAAVAFVYSAVGFGGGSSYIAVLILFDVDYLLIPIIALCCNLAVVTCGSSNFYRSGHMRLSLSLPFIITSIPCAYLGGRIPIDKTLFQMLLGILLLAAATCLCFRRSASPGDNEIVENPPLILQSITGGILGLVGGIVGIGGGVFLAPSLHYLRWGKAKEIAAACSVFILVNSAAGLLGQLHKHGYAIDLGAYWILPITVFGAGYIGSLLGSRWCTQTTVTKITAALVALVGARLLIQLTI